MAEATAKRVERRDEIAHALAAKPWLFGSGRPDRDPRVNGHKGGSAPKRSATVQAAKRKVLQSRNGQANYQLLRLELERQAQRDALVYAKDKELLQIDEMILDAQAELRALDLQAEQRRAGLEAARTDHAALVALLRDCGEQRVADACDELGWLESDEAEA